MDGFVDGWNHVCAKSGIVAEIKKYHWDLYCPTSFIKSINSPVEERQANATMHELASTWYYDACAQHPTDITASR